MTLISFCCKTKQDNNEHFYFVIKHPKINTKEPSPPSIFYGDHNFILLDTDKVFYHDKFFFYSCGTDIDFTKPPRIFLIPNSLTEIKIRDLQLFLLNNIRDTMVQGRNVMASISSPNDTIRSKAFKIITDFFKAKKIGRYVIRNWTEEEQFVTTAKIQNKQYDPTKADWNIGFDMEFSPPEDTITE